jgi:hypothetical protein
MHRASRIVIALAVAALVAVPLGARPAAAQAPAAMVSNPAADLRVMVAGLLTEHADMAVPTLQKYYDRAPDYPAAAAQMDENSVAVADTIGALYGPQARESFLALWRDHIEAYKQYTDGGRMNDAAMKAQARARLDDFIRDVSALLASANPYLSQAELERDYRVHIDQTLTIIDAYAARDFQRLYMTAHEAHMHMAMTGSMLAEAVQAQFPNRFPGATADAPAELRFMVTDMLREHTALAALASQKAIDNAPDLPFVQAALDMNTMMLTDFVRAFWGDDTADRFMMHWKQHLDAAAAYAVALRTGDRAMQQSAEARSMMALQAVANDLAVGSTILPADVLLTSFMTHMTNLKSATDAYAARQSDASFEWTHAAYMFVENKGMVLSRGVVGQNPSRFAGGQQRPTRLPRTGDGSCAVACP